MPAPVSASVAVVIPAYNEQLTIADVVSVALDFCSEVIVASDGSTDETVAFASAAGARVLDLQPNQGKGCALKAALKATSASYVIMLDADLVGLTAKHLEELITPVLSGELVMSIGVFEGGGFMTDFGNRVTPHLSGQRACPREWLLSVPHLEERWPEPAITEHLKKTNAAWNYIELGGVAQVMKEKKRGFWEGSKARTKMYADLLTFGLRKKRSED